MGLTHLLDSSVFSQPLKDRPVPSVLRRWHSLGDDVVCTSAVCLAEIIQGLEARSAERYWRRYRELLEHRYATLPFDEGVAHTFGQLSGMLRRAGRPRPLLDLMIAATAKHFGLCVATLNVRDFDRIPGVAVEDWSGELGERAYPGGQEGGIRPPL